MTQEFSRLNTQRGPTRAEVEFFRSTLQDLTDAELHTLYRTCNSRNYQDAVLRELEQRKRNSQQSPIDARTGIRKRNEPWITKNALRV